MTRPCYFDTKKSLKLFGISENFNFLRDIYIKGKLPKVLSLTGKKGIGKSTLINHLMFFIFDKDNYNDKNNELNSESIFYNNFINHSFSNIIFLSGSDFKNIRIEDIRNLKKKIFQTTISEKPRFIILDDIELFNNNSLNALLKIIEEPTKNNYFILINNKSKPLMETIKSRCLDIKIILNEVKRIDIIHSLINKFNIKLLIDPKTSQLTPGQFIKFNHFYSENIIFIDNDFLDNLRICLNLYKKDKDPIYIDIILFLTDNHFNCEKNKSAFTNEKIIECKKFVIENINKFFIYNLNQNSLLNALNNKINNE
jgi:DNA polymerase III subunit delta'